MDRIIEAKVNGGYLSLDSRKAGNQYEANITKLRITFDPSWDGYAKTVTFRDAKGQNPVKRILTADLLDQLSASTRVYLCPIPGEAMAESGMMSFSITGYVDGVRQMALKAELEVEEGDYEEEAGEPTDPTPSQAEQLQVQIDTLLNDMQEEAIKAEEAAEAAKQSENFAAMNATAAQQSAAEAQQSAATAQEAKDEAVRYASEAANHASEAKISQTNAESAMDAAKKAQLAIENMTATGEIVPADSETPLVEKQVKTDGSVNLHFNFREGGSKTTYITMTKKGGTTTADMAYADANAAILAGESLVAKYTTSDGLTILAPVAAFADGQAIMFGVVTYIMGEMKFYFIGFSPDEFVYIATVPIAPGMA